MLKKRRTLADLENAAEFTARHIGPNASDQSAMLDALGCQTLEQLSKQVVPEAIAMGESLAIDDGCTEAEALSELKLPPSQTLKWWDEGQSKIRTFLTKS